MEPETLEQKLVADLKAEGIEIAEDMAIKLIEKILDYAGKKVLESENKFDDMLIAVLPLVKAELMKLAGGIDGKKD